MAFAPTRCPAIDNVMGGGFKLGELSEVCGESGSGKTQLCLQTVANAIANPDVGGLGGSAIYITCFNPFPTNRFRTILAALQQSSQPPVNIFERVRTRRGSTPFELLDHLNEVGDLLKAADAREKNYKVMVIDTMYGFVTHQFPDTSDGAFMRTGIIRSIGYGLKRLAAKHDIAIITTNHAVDLYGGAHPNAFRTSGRLVKPRIGYMWDKNLYIRYTLGRVTLPQINLPKRTFQILDRGNCYALCYFIIGDDGVRDDESMALGSTSGGM